jgi:hypothetical protein
MTDFTGEEMRAIILRSLVENAARMRKKYKLKRYRPPEPDGTAISRRKRPSKPMAIPVATRGRSGE